MTGESGNEEALAVAPNLAASSDLDPIVDGVGHVLRQAPTLGPEPLVTDIVQVGGEGELVGHLPYCRNVIEIAERAVGIAPTCCCGRRRVGIFSADVGGRQNRERVIPKIIDSNA